MFVKLIPSRNKRRHEKRRGTTVVEAAFVLPVFFLVIFGILEFAHAQMVQNVLRSACREAARLGSTDGNSSAVVKAHVKRVLSSVVDPDKVNVYVKDASTIDAGGSMPSTGAGIEGMNNMELSDAEPRSMFLVRARVNYSEVAIIPNKYFHNVKLEGQAFMRHE